MIIDYLLHIDCEADREELVQSQLFLTTSTGSLSADGSIVAYFDDAASRDAAARRFHDIGIGVRASESERIDWLSRYQQSLRPLFIGERFVVAPQAELIPSNTGRHALVIPQEHAFGTGSHESTALAIELLETLDLAGKTALDIGAGSGILSLAMRRLGARKVIAFDNDLDAFASLRENRIRNGIGDVPVFIGGPESIRGGTFDVITMNILPEIIIPLIPTVAPLVAGQLVVSGILTRLRDEFVASVAGLRLSAERTKGEWWAALYSRR